MAPPIDSLLYDLDSDTLRDEFLEGLTLLGFDASAWEAGELPYDFTAGLASWTSRIWNVRIAPKLRARFLRTASGDELTEEAWATYDRPRQEATFAGGDVVIENRGTFVGTVSAGQIRVKNATGKTFTNTDAQYLALWSGSGAYPTATFNFRADEAGASSNTSSNALPVYPTPLAASPSALLYVQSNAALLGADQESDALVKRRCQLAAAEEGLSPRAKLEAIARDPIGAMRRANQPIPATWPPTVNVTRVRVIETGSGAFRVVCASPTGGADGTVGTVDSDLYIVNVAVQLLGVPPGGSCTVEPAVEVALDYGVIGLWVRRESTATKAEAGAVATAALETYFAELPIGGERKIAGGQGYVIHEHTLAIVTQAPVFNAAAQSITTDQALAPDEVAVPTYTVSASLISQGV